MIQVLGIDPGLEGAIALIVGGRLVQVEDMPTKSVKGRKRDVIDVENLAAVLRAHAVLGRTVAVVERVSAAPGAGVASMFGFGYGAGAIEGACRALGIEVVLVAPAVWKGALRLPGGQENKARAREAASSWWPSKAEWFKRVKDAGRAEAALIGLWWVLREQQLAQTAQLVKGGATRTNKP